MIVGKCQSAVIGKIAVLSVIASGLDDATEETVAEGLATQN